MALHLFRTVGIDHSFYRPARAAQLAHYAVQVPEYFRFCSKVCEEITILDYVSFPLYGAKAGKPNPRFLVTSSGLGLGAGTRELGIRTWSVHF
jgi:uncharacterized protein YecE (DUF72 family)